MNKEIVEGKELEFGDCLHNNTEVHFDWKDKIKILFGRPLIISLQIYVKNERVDILKSTAQSFVSPIRLFKKKFKGGFVSSGTSYFTNETTGE